MNSNLDMFLSQISSDELSIPT